MYVSKNRGPRLKAKHCSSKNFKKSQIYNSDTIET